MSDDLEALRLTFALAAVSTAVLLALGTPLAWWLARTRWRGKGLVEAAVALPLVLPPTVLGFYLLLALGPHGPLDRFLTVAVPIAGRGFGVAAVLGFAHTLGEFGIVLMIGGNIPGATRAASIAIFDRVETLDYAGAHRLSAILLATSFAVLLVSRRGGGCRTGSTWESSTARRSR